MEKAQICYVDDNQSHLMLFEHAFSDDFAIQTYSTTDGVLERIAATAPKLIVLDVNMPGMDGYQFCEQLRRHPALSSVPVVFLSCMRDVEDRLKGYEAGGDSYVTKPYDLQELRMVIRAHLMRQELCDQASKKSRHASAMAFESMRTNSELGELIQFARGVSQVRDETDFINHLFTTLKAFGLDATVLIRLLSGEVVARTDGNPFNLMEKELLELAQNADRITAYGAKYLFSGKNIVLLIKNMPVQEEALIGRLRDHLAILIESAEACVEIINGDKERQKLIDTKAKDASQTIHQEFAQILNLTDELFSHLSLDFERLCQQLEQSFFHLDLTETQEQEILSYIEKARADMDKKQDLRSKLQSAMGRISDSVCLMQKPH